MSGSADRGAAPRDFGFGEDEALLRDLARRLLDERLPTASLRALVAPDASGVYERGELPGWDRTLWKDLARLGWSGLAVPEEAGGVGARMVGIAGLLEEAGRHALPSPLLATLQASLVLREVGGDRARSALRRIAGGEAATLAITDARGRFEPGETDVRARASDGDLVLSGSASFVQDASKAERLVVAARGPASGLVLCAVPVDAPGVVLEPDHIHDLTRDQATVRFDDVRLPAEARLDDDAGAVLARAWPALLVTWAADLCGTSEWQLQTTVAYARERVQFDRPLGFFQAVKHPLVDVMVAVDRARSLLYHAACEIDRGSPEAPVAARMAKAAASDAGAFASDRSVQLHGGIGFTWESDVHLYFKRSLHAQALFGDGAHQRRKLADLLIGPPGS